MTKIALLGGAGQIAWELASFLEGTIGADVVALCRSELLAAPLLANNRSARVFNATSPDSIREAVRDIEVVIDCSFAPTAKLAKNAYLRAMYDSILSAPRLRYFVHFSSVAVYGEVTARFTTSINKPIPDTVYGAQKLSTESLIRNLAKNHRVPVLIARLGHVYGDGMAWSGLWINMIAKGIIDERAWNIPSNAIHIRQLCRAITNAVEQRVSGTWNLVGSPNSTWAEVIGWHRQALRIVNPSMNIQPDSRAASRPVRNIDTGFQLAKAAFSNAFHAAQSALVTTPSVAHAIRLTLARFRFLPSVASMKDVFGSPAILAYFGSLPKDEAMLIFDSVQLPEPFLPGSQPLSNADFEAYVDSLRTMLLSESVDAFVTSQLTPDASLTKDKSE